MAAKGEENQFIACLASAAAAAAVARRREKGEGGGGKRSEVHAFFSSLEKWLAAKAAKAEGREKAGKSLEFGQRQRKIWFCFHSLDSTG